MPIKQSAKKAARQAVKKRAVNVTFKDQMKLAIKAVKTAAENQADNINDLVVHAQKRIDKASKKNIVSKESASRKKSILMRLQNQVQAGTHTTIDKKVISKAKKPAVKKTAKKASSKKITK